VAYRCLAAALVASWLVLVSAPPTASSTEMVLPSPPPPPPPPIITPASAAPAPPAAAEPAAVGVYAAPRCSSIHSTLPGSMILAAGPVGIRCFSEAESDRTFPPRAAAAFSAATTSHLSEKVWQ